MKRLMPYSLLAVSLVAHVGAVAAKTAPEDQVALTICLMNDAGVSPAMQGNVEQQVSALMREAGIKVRWMRGTDPNRSPEVHCVCSHPEPMRVVIVHWMKTGRQAVSGELGEAFLGEKGEGVIADIFLEPMEHLKEERNVSFTQLLAHVTAHELGHLLLGPNSHSAGGLMQARLNEESLERLAQGSSSFSRKQVDKIQERVKATGQGSGWWRNVASCSNNTAPRRLNQADAM